MCLHEKYFLSQLLKFVDALIRHGIRLAVKSIQLRFGSVLCWELGWMDIVRLLLATVLVAVPPGHVHRLCPRIIHHVHVDFIHLGLPLCFSFPPY